MAFEFAPLQLVPALVGAVLYGRRARTLRDRGAPVAAWRQWCWYGGLALMVATLVSPLAHMAEELFLAHMLEHLLLADLGALLLVLGLTGPLLQPLLHALPWLRVFGHPVVALGAWTANFYVWHLPALYQARDHQRRRARAPAHPVRVLRDRDVDGAARAAAEARVVRQRRRRSATSSPSG